MNDMISGRIDMVLEPTSVTLAHVREGTIRPLAVTSRARNPELPDLPTMGESGVPGVVAVSWTGVSAPAGTPADIVTKLNRAINDSLRAEDMQFRCASSAASRLAERRGISAHCSPKNRRNGLRS